MIFPNNIDNIHVGPMKFVFTKEEKEEVVTDS